MSTFGRIVNGSVTDVCMGPDVATAVGQAFAKPYVDGLGGAQEWVIIKAGTVEGSTTGDGVNFAAPPVVAPPAPSVDPMVTLTASVAALAVQVQSIADSVSTLQAAVVAAVPAAAQAVSDQLSQVAHPG